MKLLIFGNYDGWFIEILFKEVILRLIIKNENVEYIITILSR